MKKQRAVQFLTGIAIGVAIVAGCGLIPDALRGSGMSNKEKAQMNVQMGIRYIELGQLETAKQKLENALDLDSGSSEVHNAMAVFAERIQDDELAREHYQTAIHLNPDDMNVKNNYGRYLCEKGSYPEGMTLLSQTAAMPLNARPWFAQANLAHCYIKQGDNKNAEYFFRKALEGQSNYAPALAAMQKISYDNGQYLSARAFLERYLAVGQHTAETLWIALNTERQLGNMPAAQELLGQLLNSFPNSKEAQQAKTAGKR